MTKYKMVKPIPNIKGVWYKIEVEECPVCGKYEEHRTRMPPPAPEDVFDRFEYSHHYDYCLEQRYG